MLLDKASTDWLNTRPVFYNDKTGAISHNMREVIDFADFEFDAEGLRNYLIYGYTVYGQTMVKHVKSLDHSSQIIKNADNTLTITHDEDVADRLWNPGQLNGREVFEHIVESTREWINEFESPDGGVMGKFDEDESQPEAGGNCKYNNSKVILPLSGGFDSRLLAYAASSKAEDNAGRSIYAYSYGLSARQQDSFEVVKAKEVAKKCGLKWQHVNLDSFLRDDYLERWYKLYGPSCHLHGMYQMEFYDKICRDFSENGTAGGFGKMVPHCNFDAAEKSAEEIVGANCKSNISIGLLSGIIGDGWAGTVRVPDIDNPVDLKYLGYTHGMSIEDDICLLDGSKTSGAGSRNNRAGELAEQYFENHREELKNENWRILAAMRTKMMLLCYLLKTPESMGITTWSPFLEADIAMSMLNLDWSLKTERVWQQKEFDRLSLNIGWEKKKCDYNMVLDIENLRMNPVRPLNVELLGRVISPEYIKNVNLQIKRRPMRPLPAKPKTLQNMYNKAVKRYNRQIDEALIRYEILGSIERLMLEAEEYRKH